VVDRIPEDVAVLGVLLFHDAERVTIFDDIELDVLVGKRLANDLLFDPEATMVANETFWRMLVISTVGWSPGSLSGPRSR
jgi:hypothetical protein